MVDRAHTQQGSYEGNCPPSFRAEIVKNRGENEMNNTNDSLPICIAIPVNSFDQGIELAQTAVEKRAQYIEFRIDYDLTVGSWPLSNYKTLVQSVSVPVILTMRKRGEGGQQDIEEQARFEIISRCIQAKPSYVDVESRIDKEILHRFYKEAAQSGVKLIYSYHDFHKTPSYEDSEILFQEYLDNFPSFHNCPTDCSAIDDVVKFVFYANNDEDPDIPLKLCELAHKRKIKIVSFCMGQFGIRSRVTCIKHGSLFSFASLTQSTAPGQVSVDEFYTRYYQQ
jgi:3-dehydroquinate dehydratase type I